MPARYWTPEFVEAFVKALETDAAFQKSARSLQGAVCLRCVDTPDGNDVSAVYIIDHGRVRVEMELLPAPAPALRNAPFDKGRYFARTTAPYALWTRLDRGEMNVVQAIASPDYRVEGSKLRIMANLGLFNAMNAVAARIEKTY